MNGDGDGDGGDPQLPQEVLMEILKRLPMKLLLRLRCVLPIMAFRHRRPYVRALHYRHSALDPSNWYLVCLDYRDGFQGTCSLVPYDSLTLPFQLGVRTPFDTPIRFVGSCNGLIGVAEFSRNREGQYMHLWNLFTGKHKAVRLYPPRKEPRFLSKEANSEFVGIGFDARSNNYKIVRILHFHVDGRWIDKAVFLNGNLYWVAFKLDDKLDDTGSASEDASLFMFDLVREVFYEMALPEETFQNKNKSASLKVSVAVLNESLTVFIGAEVSEVVEDYDLYYFICSVWVMRESWTKLYTFQNPEVVERFYGWMCDELLMEIPRLCSSRISWNWITGSFKVLPLPGTTDLVPVVENLISPEI
ncbi:uncharacterized protein LOC104441189 [Eucalyptus grandis]|uniref:uncharacterized protein LOC104441189 n=1 Tax=Eucalyptus grandis TaxID=71139 RepID=UPI00192F001B|nr:uncharacterized protein LOC104441189 [Eucalyptus grandis]